MKNLVKIAGAAIALSLTSTQVFAQAATPTDIPFSGSITNTCTITAVTPGTLGAANNNTELTSDTTAGGAAGGATVTTNSGIFEVSADAPTAFGGGSPDVSALTVGFDASYSFGTNTDIDGGTATALPSGVTNVAVDMSATADGPLPTGTYSAIVVLRCE